MAWKRSGVQFPLAPQGVQNILCDISGAFGRGKDIVRTIKIGLKRPLNLTDGCNKPVL